MGRSVLALSTQPGGLTSIQSLLEHPGNVWFVDASAAAGADTSGHGFDPLTPFVTLAYAVSQASADDTIVLMPGHTETIATATALNINKDNLRIVGLGQGLRRPTITLGTATTAIVTVSKTNVLIENVRFVSALASVAVALNLAAGASGAVIRRCEFRDKSTILQFLVALSIADTVTDVIVEDCHFISLGTADTQAILIAGASANTKIRRNRIMGTYSTAAIDGQTTANSYLEIEQNVIFQLDSTGGLAVKLNATTTGYIVGNRIFGGKDNTAPVIAAACLSADNFGTTDRLEGAVQLPMTLGLETWA